MATAAPYAKMPDAPMPANFCTACGSALQNGGCPNCGTVAAMAQPVSGGGYPGAAGGPLPMAQPVGAPPVAQAYVITHPAPVAFMERPPPVGGGWTWLFFLLGFIFPVLWVIGACFACAGPPRERAGGRACLCMLVVLIVVIIIIINEIGTCPNYGSCGSYSDSTCCNEDNWCYWSGNQCYTY